MDIGIAGAGILGQVCALNLLQAGHQVTIFDPGTPPGSKSCSLVGAGMLAPYAEVEMTEALILKMGKDSISRWKTIVASLTRPVYFQTQGSLLIAHRQDHSEIDRFQNTYQKKVGSTQGLDLVDANQIQRIEPALGHRFQKGIYLPDEGQIDATHLLPALTDTLRSLGVTWHQENITKIQPYCIQTQQQNEMFDMVLDCRGLGAKSDYPQLRGVRGEILWLTAPEVQLQRVIRLLHPRYAVYIAPRPNSTYILGATTIESDDDSPISVQSLLELLSAIYSLHSGFAEARLQRTAAHCRPAFPDNLPKIFHQPGLIAANGLYRHGFLLTPLLSEMICLLVQGEKPIADHGIINSV